jgi:hypothetical protein
LIRRIQRTSDEQPQVETGTVRDTITQGTELETFTLQLEALRERVGGLVEGP